MATYLVTGATGFLGQHLCQRLVKAQAQVRALVRTPLNVLDKLGVEQVKGDVLDARAVRAAADGVDAVFHLAGRVSRNPDDAAALHKLHVQGTQIVVNACRDARIGRMVHCSSSGTVGVTAPPGEELDENASPDLSILGRWPYYLSKLYAEQVALAANGNGLDVVSINPSLLLGPGDDRGDSVRDVRFFMERKFPGYTPGGVSIVDVRDAADALWRGLQKGQGGRRYLVTGLNTTVKDFFERISRISGVPAPLIPMPGPVGLMSARLLDGVARLLEGTNPLDEVSVEMSGYCWYVNPRRGIVELGLEYRDPGETLLATVEDLRARGVKTDSSLPPGSGLAGVVAADAWRALDRWRRRAEGGA